MSYNEHDETPIYDQMAKYIIEQSTNDFDLVKQFPFMIKYAKINVTKEIKEWVMENAPSYFTSIPSAQLTLNDRKRMLISNLKRHGNYWSSYQTILADEHDYHSACILLDSKILFEPYFNDKRYIKKFIYHLKTNDISDYQNRHNPVELFEHALQYYQNNLKSVNAHCAKNIVYLTDHTTEEFQAKYATLLVYIADNFDVCRREILRAYGFTTVLLELYFKYGVKFLDELFEANQIYSKQSFDRAYGLKPLMREIVKHDLKFKYDFPNDSRTTVFRCENYYFIKIMRFISKLFKD